MFEVRYSEAWHSPLARVIPTTNLTPAEVKKLDERERLIDAALAEMEQPNTHVRINAGIFKGSIFRIPTKDNAQWYIQCFLRDATKDAVEARWGLYSFTKGLDSTKGWQFAPRYLQFYTRHGNKPIKIGNETIYTEFLGGELDRSSSWLIDYTGDQVFCLDAKKRPTTFTDRLKQKVQVGDLVVVALNYGEGLEVCLVKGFSDERRVVIEKIENGGLDRIPLEKNATRKIMRMPNTLKDIALMMKLARS